MSRTLRLQYDYRVIFLKNVLTGGFKASKLDLQHHQSSWNSKILNRYCPYSMHYLAVRSLVSSFFGTPLSADLKLSTERAFSTRRSVKVVVVATQQQAAVKQETKIRGSQS
ncbi:hypothetical protein R1sor_008298 [Riccia sorocarpa]|uniref:Uncharacterized protein n=1 Tax=Riccia sorocarpa TaxID=122646 RepID=A0ABD3HWG8_9MARC